MNDQTYHHRRSRRLQSLPLRVLTAVLSGLLLISHGHAQTTTTLLDQVYGPYRVVATLKPNQVSIGPADIVVTITDSANGTPKPVSAVNIIMRSPVFGRDQLYIAPPLDDNRMIGIYKSHRLYFSASGVWTIRIQVITNEGPFELATSDVEVGSIYERIGQAAIIAVPATVGGLLVLALAWTWYRRHTRN